MGKWWVCGGSTSAVAPPREAAPVASIVAAAPTAAVDDDAVVAEATATPLMTLRSPLVAAALEVRPFLTPPAPAGEAHAEGDALEGDELAEARAVAAALGARARAVASGAAGYHALRRCVRGYWTYADRVAEMAASLEKFAALRDRFRLDALAADDAAARARGDKLLGDWDNIGFAAYDAYGHPIVSERVAETLRRVNVAETDPDELLEGRAVCTEAFQALKARATARAPERRAVLKHVYVVDMQAVRLAMVTRRVRNRFRVIMTTLEAVYPEVCWRTYVVNAPVYLTIIWTVVRSWLHPITANKVRILGTDRDFIRKTLEDDGVPPEAVPACCGGPAPEVALADLYAGAPSATAPPDGRVAAAVATPVDATGHVSKAVAAYVASPRREADPSVAVDGGRAWTYLFVPAAALICYLLWR